MIDPREVLGATEKQRWWSNNRMNQAMIWADLLREDHEDQTALRCRRTRSKRSNILRKVCVAVAKRAPDDELTEEGPDEGDTDAGSTLGSPVLWTILLALEMIARRPEGFKVRRPEFQAIATLEGMHKYLSRFQSRATKRHVEKLNFYTRAKGAEARMAEQPRPREDSQRGLRWTWRQPPAPGQDRDARPPAQKERRVRRRCARPAHRPLFARAQQRR